MELRFLPTQHQPQSQQPQPQQIQNNNCNTITTPDPHRRSLERGLRQLHQVDPKMMLQDGIMNEHGRSGVGGGGGGNSGGAAVRRTRRTSGSGGSPRIIRGVSSELLQHNRSPLPVRTTGHKRGNRLGNRTENMSSGSLNSIEV